MEVLPIMKYQSSVEAHWHFAYFVCFAGPIGLPMKCSKWKKFPAYGGCSAHFSISITNRTNGIKMKYVPKKEARHISLALSASQGLLARPWSVPSEKNIWQSLCAHFSISVTNRSIEIKMKSVPRKDARDISLTLSALKGLLARPWSVSVCTLFNVCY